MEDMFRFGDELGPLKIIHVREPSINLMAVLVVDNIARGPAIGGMRMAEDVTTEECVRLARAMTFKNAAAGLPHGGGKLVIFGDPKMPKTDKQQIMRGLANALRCETTYIFAPDMGTNEECMGVACSDDLVQGNSPCCIFVLVSLNQCKQFHFLVDRDIHPTRPEVCEKQGGDRIFLGHFDQPVPILEALHCIDKLIQFASR